jgi:membrane protease YdiL (CAAX protease family)
MKPYRDGLAVLFAMLFPTLATWVYFDLLHGSEWMRAGYLAGKVVQFGFPLVWVGLIQRGSLRLGRPSGKGLIAGSGFGVLVGAGMLWLYEVHLKSSPYLAETSARLWDKLSVAGIDSSARFLALAAFVALLHSLLEEYYWRWFVFGQLRRGLPVFWAILLSSLAFAAHHVILVAAYMKPEHFWTATVGLSACVAFGGAFWAWLYHRSGSLYGPWLSHLLVDAALMWIGFDLVRSHFSS